MLFANNVLAKFNPYPSTLHFYSEVKEGDKRVRKIQFEKSDPFKFYLEEPVNGKWKLGSHLTEQKLRFGYISDREVSLSPYLVAIRNTLLSAKEFYENTMLLADPGFTGSNPFPVYIRQYEKAKHDPKTGAYKTGTEADTVLGKITAYMILDSGLSLDRVFAVPTHELFHVYQYYDQDLSGVYKPTNQKNLTLLESTAAWSTDLPVKIFYRGLENLMNGEQTLDDINSLYPKRFSSAFDTLYLPYDEKKKEYERAPLLSYLFQWVGFHDSNLEDIGVYKKFFKQAASYYLSFETLFEDFLRPYGDIQSGVTRFAQDYLETIISQKVDKENIGFKDDFFQKEDFSAFVGAFRASGGVSSIDKLKVYESYAKDDEEKLKRLKQIAKSYDVGRFFGTRVLYFKNSQVREEDLNLHLAVFLDSGNYEKQHFALYGQSSGGHTDRSLDITFDEISFDKENLDTTKKEKIYYKFLDSIGSNFDSEFSVAYLGTTNYSYSNHSYKLAYVISPEIIKYEYDPKDKCHKISTDRICVLKGSWGDSYPKQGDKIKLRFSGSDFFFDPSLADGDVFKKKDASISLSLISKEKEANSEIEIDIQNLSPKYTMISISDFVVEIEIEIPDLSDTAELSLEIGVDSPLKLSEDDIFIESIKIYSEKETDLDDTTPF